MLIDIVYAVDSISSFLFETTKYFEGKIKYFFFLSKDLK